MAILTIQSSPLVRAGLRWLRRLGWCLLAVALVPTVVRAAAPREYQVKAVFLFNFAQFVEWPPDAFAEAKSPLCIGVIGEDPFGADLDEVVQGETVNDRPLIVRRFHSPAEIGSCHVLFVASSEADRLAEILAAVQGRSVLTVGDFKDFASRGGMIHFVTQRNKLRLQINMAAARTSGLTISSMLLRSATVVATGED